MTLSISSVALLNAQVDCFGQHATRLVQLAHIVPDGVNIRNGSIVSRVRNGSNEVRTLRALQFSDGSNYCHGSKGALIGPKGLTNGTRSSSHHQTSNIVRHCLMRVSIQQPSNRLRMVRDGRTKHCGASKSAPGRVQMVLVSGLSSPSVHRSLIHKISWSNLKSVATSIHPYPSGHIRKDNHSNTSGRNVRSRIPAQRLCKIVVSRVERRIGKIPVVSENRINPFTKRVRLRTPTLKQSGSSTGRDVNLKARRAPHCTENESKRDLAHHLRVVRSNS